MNALVKYFDLKNWEKNEKNEKKFVFELCLKFAKVYGGFYNRSLERFSDPDSSLNRKRKMFKIFKIKSRLNWIES